MTTLKFMTVDQHLVLQRQPVVASGDKNSVLIQIQLCSMWDGFDVKVAFYKDGNRDFVLDIPLANGECMVPPEMLDTPCVLNIGVWGKDAGGRYKTSTMVKYRVAEGTPIEAGLTLIDVSDGTAQEDQVLEGATFYAGDTEMKTGNVKTYEEGDPAYMTPYIETDPTVPAWAKNPTPPTETDPTVPAWAKKPNPPTAAEVGAAPAGFGLGVEIGVIPANSVCTLKFGTHSVALISALAWNGNSNYIGYFTSYASGGANRSRYKEVLHGTNIGVTYGEVNGTSCFVIWNHGAIALPVYTLMLSGHIPQFVAGDDSGLTELPYEYENPPMMQGVEYRTTERMNGKAVYKKNDNGVIKYRLDGETTWNDYAPVYSAAPAGFGLGQTYPEKLTDDPAVVDSWKGNGWYAYYNTDVSLIPSTNWGYYGSIRVDAGVFGYRQTFVPRAHPDHSLIRSLSNDGAWTEWEWVNPPMQLGVEYRTTERWLGKPVYVQMISCGALPASGRKTVNIPNVAAAYAVIKSVGYTIGTHGINVEIPNIGTGLNSQVDRGVITVNLHNISETDTSAVYTDTRIAVYYTKTTD